jgi:hypothetical protein
MNPDGRAAGIVRNATGQGFHGQTRVLPWRDGSPELRR